MKRAKKRITKRIAPKRPSSKRAINKDDPRYISDEDLALQGKRRIYAKKASSATPMEIETRPAPRTSLECGAPQPWSRNGGDEYAISQGCYFDETQAEFVRGWLARYLKHTGGKFFNQPFEVTDWQYENIIAPVFGWFRADGVRRIRRVYIEIPKKNGKSTLSSAIGIFMLLGDGEQSANVFSAATSKDQASIVHDEAISMVQGSPILNDATEINRTTRVIVHWPTRSSYRAISSRVGGNEGLKAHCVIADELHAWRGTELWQELKYSGRSRKQPLSFAMTTAGNTKDGVAWSEHEYVEDVNSGDILDAGQYGLILSLREGEDYRDKAVQERLNPMLGVTIDREEFASDIYKAQKQSSTMANMQRYTFNVWSTTEGAWLDKDMWKHLYGEIDWQQLADDAMPAWLGIDLSQSVDMTAAALAIPSKDKSKIYLMLKFWMPEGAVNDHVLRDTLKFWAKEGHLEMVRGPTIVYKDIEDWLIGICNTYNIREIAYDKFYASPTAQRVHRETGTYVQEFGQTMGNFALPSRDFENAIHQKTLCHDGNLVMEWQVGSVAMHEDNNSNIRPVKPKRDDYRKVDGVIAAVMAVGRAMSALKKPKTPKSNLVEVM